MMNTTIKAQRLSNVDARKFSVSNGMNENNRLNISYDSSRFIFQTPFMKVQDRTKKTDYKNIVQLNTIVDTSKEKERVFFQVIDNLETIIMDHISHNGNGWFKDNNVDIKSLMRENESLGGYYIKWPIYTDQNLFVDESGSTVDISKIDSSNDVKLIVEISEIWTTSNACGSLVNVKKGLVRKSHAVAVNEEYVFENSASSEDNHDDNLISLLATEQIQPMVRNTNSKGLNYDPDRNRFVKTNVDIVPGKNNDSVQNISCNFDDITPDCSDSNEDSGSGSDPF